MLLNVVLYLPLALALIVAVMPRTMARHVAIAGSWANFVVSLGLLSGFNASNNAEFQLVTRLPWIPQFGVQYLVGVDGISLVLVLLTTLLSAIATMSSFSAIEHRQKEYYVFLLLLQTGMLGVFVALDLILFYVFWEAMLIPMYFLIGIWGGPRKLYATIKFVLYTLVGSLLMLVAIIWLYVASGHGGQPGTFDLTRLLAPDGPFAQGGGLAALDLRAVTGDPRSWGALFSPGTVRLWLFLAFALAFAIKVPVWPLHTWLPDAHVEAPTAGSVILAGVLLKMGTYGFVRFCIPLFPDVALKLAPWFLGIAVIGIIYGALVAYVQQDVKRLVAYSSVSHLGFCVLGLFAFTAEAVNGSVLQMINHGLSTGALFLIVGMIYERRHTREIAAFGGLWKVMPIFAAFFVISMLSSVGLPGLNGFIGEFMILLGTFGGPDATASYQWAAVISATGVILGAVYLLWMFQRVMQGPLDRPENRSLRDLNFREVMTLLPLAVLMFWIGVYPNSTLALFDQAVYRNVVRPIQLARSAPAGGPGLTPPPQPSIDPEMLRGLRGGIPGGPGGIPGGPGGMAGGPGGMPGGLGGIPGTRPGGIPPGPRGGAPGGPTGGTPPIHP
jgi:NADH-quinone oxidoreductase subunit M